MMWTWKTATNDYFLEMRSTESFGKEGRQTKAATRPEKVWAIFDTKAIL